MHTHVEFRSDRFPAVEGEGEKVNPQRHGERLARFIQSGLLERGFEAEEPFAEDWGWFVPIRNASFRLGVACGNSDASGDDYLCFIEPQKPIIRKWFRKIDTTARVSAVRAALDDLLNAQGIRDKTWRDIADAPANDHS